MFKCFLDDSDNRASAICLLAGYVARQDLWSDFEKVAEVVFKNYGVNTLHTKDLARSKGEFRGWSKLKKNSFIVELFAIGRNRIDFGLSVAVRRSTHKIFQKQSRRNQSMSPYCVAFSTIWHTLTQNNTLREDIQNEGLEFLIETGHRNNREVELFFHKKKGHPVFRDIETKLRFVDKNDCRAIQLADFNAYFSRRFQTIEDRFNGKLAIPVPELLEIARQEVPHFHRTIRGDVRSVSTQLATKPPIPALRWQQTVRTPE